MSIDVKETKAQRVERIKREKDGLDVLEDIKRYAITGEEINPEDIDRFKWYGLYTQNKNLQGDDTSTYYMLRVKVEQGFISAEQLLEIAKISQEFARDTADITTRQDIQFHWISIKDISEIFARLYKVGLSALGASGDCPRNIVSCALNGSSHEQVDDVRDIVDALNNLYRANRDFSNLPRKFKIAVSGCSKHCINHEVQDLSFTAVKRANGSLLFSVSVGGGQASNKRIASHIGYIQREEIVAVAKAVATLYRDNGRRDNRSKARLGHLLDVWGVENFSNELQVLSGVTFIAFDAIPFTPYPRRTHFGIMKSRNDNFNNIGYAITSGRIGGKISTLANVVNFYGARGISLTATQNFIVRDVQKEVTEPLTQTLEASLGLSVTPSVFQSRTLACTGLNFCKLAISETKNFSIELVNYLNKKFPDFSEPVSISINGCPNACAHPHIVDLGFIGAKIKKDNETVSGFNLVVGGHLNGTESKFALKTPVKVTQDEVPAFVESLILEYEKSFNENFQNFILEKYTNESNI